MTTPPSTRQEVTQLLGDWSGGDEGALGKLMPLVQPELHRLAHHYMSRERAGHTLQTTALLNEAYLRLVDNTKPLWQNRTHFLAAAVQYPRKSQIGELRYFGGLTVEETAEFLKLSQRTVEREWNMAKAWLYRALSEEET